ncbi:hypothetical protein [Mycobacterium sp. 050134]|uniref:hypothetical protein n=1 Tax=Mycobacterium sp. 050134 TaxID=3096111 RepID=UPI002ED8991A
MVATLSQIHAWSTDHLVNAASHWTDTGDRWEDTFLRIRNQSHTMTWHGEGGDALRQRTSADLATVSAKADQLRQAAGIARSGASDIGAAQRRVIYGVEDAQNAGFVVGEDLSVTDTRMTSDPVERATRQAQAEAFAGDLRARAEQLELTETKVAGQLTASTADVDNIDFGPEPTPKPQIPNDRNGIQLVDFKQDGPTPAPPLPPGQPVPPQPPAIKITPHPNPPAVINTHAGENPVPDPGKHECDGWDITKYVGEGVGGPLLVTGSVMGGIAASPLGPAEWAMAIGGVLTGGATTIDGFKGLAGCE